MYLRKFYVSSSFDRQLSRIMHEALFCAEVSKNCSIFTEIYRFLLSSPIKVQADRQLSSLHFFKTILFNFETCSLKISEIILSFLLKLIINNFDQAHLWYKNCMGGSFDCMKMSLAQLFFLSKNILLLPNSTLLQFFIQYVLGKNSSKRQER